MKNLLIIFGSIILLGAATCGGCGDTCSASATHRTVLTSHFNNNDNPKNSYTQNHRHVMRRMCQ